LPEPAQHRPWAGPEKILAPYRGECGLEPGIADARGGQNLPGIGRADDAKFALTSLPFPLCRAVLGWVCD